MSELTYAELSALRARRGEVPTTLIVAAKRCGKTTYMRHTIRGAPEVDWIVWDPLCEYHALDFNQRATTVRTAAELRRLPRKEAGWVYLVQGDTGEHCAELALGMGQCALVWDEADRCIGKDNYVDRESACWAALNANRQPEVAVYVCCRRPADIWLTVESNATHLVLGYIQQPNDVEKLRKYSTVAVDMALQLPAPNSNKSGVYMIETNLQGALEPRRIFVPHKAA
jgi:hypothetical protein